MDKDLTLVERILREAVSPLIQDVSVLSSLVDKALEQILQELTPPTQTRH